MILSRCSALEHEPVSGGGGEEDVANEGDFRRRAVERSAEASATGGQTTQDGGTEGDGKEHAKPEDGRGCGDRGAIHDPQCAGQHFEGREDDGERGDKGAGDHAEGLDGFGEGGGVPHFHDARIDEDATDDDADGGAHERCGKK